MLIAREANWNLYHKNWNQKEGENSWIQLWTTNRSLKCSGNTVKNEVCKAHQIVSIHTLFGKKCAYRDILVCMAHFSIYSEGFKIVGDNIDKNIRPSMQRLTHQTRSLHHFHSYAMKDRVDWSKVSDIAHSPELDITSFLMNEKDWDKFKGDCEVLISR